MQDATEFGKVIRGLMVQNNLCQNEMAGELGVKPSTLSNYLTGKSVPEMDFLVKCVDRFALKGNDLKNLFDKAFYSSVQGSHKIILDTRYFREDRIGTLLQVIVVLQLCSDSPSFQNFKKDIKGWYDGMETDRSLELIQPSEDEIDNS
jgi:transcriptional regulator with XRE-family HTH domain